MTAEEIFNEKSYFNKWLKELTDSEKHLIIEMLNEFASQKDASNDKANLGMATTSELIYELAARCDTGSIDKGGNYKTVDND